MSGRSVNLTTLFLGRLRPPKRLTSTSCTYFHQLLTIALLEKAEGETKVCCQTGYRTRDPCFTSHWCPTDCATRPGSNVANDWSESWYALVSWMIDQSLKVPWSHRDLSQYFFFSSFFFFFFFYINIWLYYNSIILDWYEKMMKKEILLQVPVLETTEQRYGSNKGYVLNFSLSQVLWCLLSVIALCEKNDWRQ